jgi:hypothetical protein
MDRSASFIPKGLSVFVVTSVFLQTKAVYCHAVMNDKLVYLQNLGLS